MYIVYFFKNDGMDGTIYSIKVSSRHTALFVKNQYTQKGYISWYERQVK